MLPPYELVINNFLPSGTVYALFAPPTELPATNHVIPTTSSVASTKIPLKLTNSAVLLDTTWLGLTIIGKPWLQESLLESRAISISSICKYAFGCWEYEFVIYNLFPIGTLYTLASSTSIVIASPSKPSGKA